jgi:phosphopantothenate-cysteine ligase/phosphopantothenoylcysteine decarboxylase/phosphopantothenate--cysteine ligase
MTAEFALLMNILVTAGNTLVLIDRVRAITNIFTGRTGAAIAQEAHRRGHVVTLLTSQPETATAVDGRPNWRCIPYRTLDDLQKAMAAEIARRPDVVVHSAAVSDFHVDGVYAATPGSSFDPTQRTWQGDPPTLVDRSAGKVKSDEPELWLRLVRATKLIDRVRGEWSFRGILVKFKLEVGTGDADLLRIAEQSRRHSDADWMVANTLEGAAEWAYLGSAAGYERIARADLPGRLLDALEKQSVGRANV